MVKLYDGGVYLVNGNEIVPEAEAARVEQMTGKKADPAEAKKGTIAYSIMKAHNISDNMDNLRIRFDAMTSHDITFVGIIQTARASGMEKFPLPYVLTNCHNSLCAVGGTINEDDHMFGLTAAKKYGGIYVPPHIGVIHQYMREMMAGCGKMILGSDSHTRYGALGTMAIGEGGGELGKQLLRDTYDVAYPGVVAIYLDGKPAPYVGPQDIALAIIGAVFKKGYVKNKVMEFVGPGVSTMTTDYRNGVDVMTTETTCLSSVWRTDEDTKEFLASHGRPDDYRELNPADVAYYDGCVYVDLSSVKPMIALPFHPSNTYTIDELNANLGFRCSRVSSQAARAATTRTLLRRPICCAARAAARANSPSMSILPHSRYLSIWREKDTSRTLWEQARSSRQRSADPASAQVIRLCTTASPSATRQETSRTAKVPSPATARCLHARSWMRDPSRRQLQTAAS